MKNWFTPRTLLVAAGVAILALLVWRFSNIDTEKTVTNMLSDFMSILENLAWAFLAISFISFFLLREEKLISGYIVTIFPKDKAFTHALESIKRLLRRYFIGIMLQMCGILIMVTLGMTIIGIGFRLGLAGIVGMILAIPTYTIIRVFAKDFFNNFRVVQKLTEKI